MKEPRNILLLVFKEDENQIENLIKNALLLSDKFNARLSICSMTGQVSIIQNAISKVNRFTYPIPIKSLDLHYGSLKEELTQLVLQSSTNIIFVQYDPARPYSRHFEHHCIVVSQKRELLEFSTVPVLLVPIGLQMESKPFFSFVVPMSGERRNCESLYVAIQLGNELKIPVDLIHVMEDKVTDDKQALELNSTPLDQASDQIHREYPRLLDEFISRATPFCGPQEQQIIRHFYHCVGNAASVIRDRMQSSQKSLLLFEWKGVFDKGRAKVLKALLTSATYPLLLVKSKQRKPAILKVGKNFRAA